MKYPFYLAGKPVTRERSVQVLDKFTGKVFAEVSEASRSDLETALQSAEKVTPLLAARTANERAEWLAKATLGIEKRKSLLEKTLIQEVGKPIRDAENEVARLIETFRFAEAHARTFRGEMVPMNASARGKGYRAMVNRVPIGVCSFVVPFNFPLNLAAHKIAPAIAVGCPFVMKASTRTPVSAVLLGEILSELGMPEGSFSILPTRREDSDLFVESETVKLLSFTGSPAVGWDMKKRAGAKKVVLELGGNAAVIIDQTWEQKDAIARLLIGIFAQSGQSCISVQRIFIDEEIYEGFRSALVDAVKTVRMGDPSERETAVGPLISESEAKRLEDWVSSAVKKGANVLCGGKRHGRLFEPTLLEKVPPEEKLCTQEAFGPVAVLEPFKTFESALQKVNASRFGLQAGVFTRDLGRALQAWDELDVGGVIVGDIPSFRTDQMPYGGVKESGLGREGILYAMEEMTEMRLLVLREPPR